MQPYDDEGFPPPNDPAADLPDPHAPADVTPGEPLAPADVPPGEAVAPADEPAPYLSGTTFDVSDRVDVPRHGRPVAPKLLSHLTVIGLILAAVLIAAGVAFVWGDDAERGALPPKPHPTGQQTNNAVVAQRAGIGDLLERRGKAIRDHDKAAFLALIDPTAEQFRVDQGQLFDRLSHVPFSTWSYELAGDGPALPKDRLVALPKGSTIARVRLDYQLAGSDSDVEREQYLTVVPRGGQWLLAGDTTRLKAG